MADTLRFHVTAERANELTLGQLLDAEEKPSVKSMVDILWMFVTNGDGNYPDEDEARRLVRQMTVKQMREVVPRVVSEIREGVVPNE